MSHRNTLEQKAIRRAERAARKAFAPKPLYHIADTDAQFAVLTGSGNFSPAEQMHFGMKAMVKRAAKYRRPSEQYLRYTKYQAPV